MCRAGRAEMPARDVVHAAHDPRHASTAPGLTHFRDTGRAGDENAPATSVPRARDERQRSSAAMGRSARCGTRRETAHPRHLVKAVRPGVGRPQGLQEADRSCRGRAAQTPPSRRARLRRPLRGRGLRTGPDAGGTPARRARHTHRAGRRPSASPPPAPPRRADRRTVGRHHAPKGTLRRLRRMAGPYDAHPPPPTVHRAALPGMRLHRPGVPGTAPAYPGRPVAQRRATGRRPCGRPVSWRAPRQGAPPPTQCP